MRLATWKINSVRFRIDDVLKFVKVNNIDVMCLCDKVLNINALKVKDDRK